MSSSDSELGAPSPLPSPIFARCSPARGTVARRCREFYVRRLERTALMQKRWSICCEGEGLIPEGEEPGAQGLPRSPCEAGRGVPVDEGYPLRKCRSSLDLAMDSLRKEISSLIAQDNDLFRQLLSLHDSIAELRERQRRSFLCPDDDEDDDIDVEEEDEVTTGDDDHSRGDRRSLSLESLSDPQETSPDSTLSCRSSLSGTSSDYKPIHRHHHHRYGGNHRNNNRHRSTPDAKHRKVKGGDGGGSRPIVFVDKSEVCFRCRKVAPPYRRSTSVASLYYLQEDLESFDSGIHLQGSHSDSDHEIFV